MEENELSSESEESDVVIESSGPVSYTDAINATNLLINWVEQNADVSGKHMSNLLSLRSDVVKKHILKPPKQMKLTSFFKK